ncbi:MAG: chaperonin GroES [Patescibacteria group bacterium]|jgi:chaperonin GroES|nr:chaperonin GroES [Patescibacteria group bacterium]
MSLQPLADRIVLEQIESEEKTSSGIILPDSAKEKPEQAKVIAIGPDVKGIKVGEVVLYTKYGPNEVKVDGNEYLIVKEEDVMAIIKKGN